jgi:undecaprenyl-diphosphatase
VVVAASAVVALVAGLKLLIGATSPWTELSGSHADNFPSGHVAYATAVFGAIAWLARGRGDRDVATLAVAVVALMGPARISVRAHLLSDVLAGYAVGAAWLLVVVAVSGRRGR